MTEQSDTDLLNEIASYLITRGAQWADLDAAVRRTGNHEAIKALETFGIQLKESDQAMGMAAQRLAARGEINEAGVIAATNVLRVRFGHFVKPAEVRAALEAAQKGETP